METECLQPGVTATFYDLTADQSRGLSDQFPFIHGRGELLDSLRRSEQLLLPQINFASFSNPGQLVKELNLARHNLISKSSLPLPLPLLSLDGRTAVRNLSFSRGRNAQFYNLAALTVLTCVLSVWSFDVNCIVKLVLTNEIWLCLLFSNLLNPALITVIWSGTREIVDHSPVSILSTGGTPSRGMTTWPRPPPPNSNGSVIVFDAYVDLIQSGYWTWGSSLACNSSLMVLRSWVLHRHLESAIKLYIDRYSLPNSFKAQMMALNLVPI